MGEVSLEAELELELEDENEQEDEQEDEDDKLIVWTFCAGAKFALMNFVCCWFSQKYVGYVWVPEGGTD